MARAADVSRPTVRKAVRELEDEPEPASGWSRRPGGGRKRLAEKDPALVRALEELVDPSTRGDPMSPLRWWVRLVSVSDLSAEAAPAWRLT